MNVRKTRIASLLLAAALGASLLTAPAAAAGNGVSAWTDTIGGKSAKIVSVEMTPGRTGVVSLANNSVVEAMPAKSIIDAENAKGHTVVAAINGGFFNAYTKGSPVFPNSCPLIMDAVVKDGQLIHTGRSSMLGFTADGRPMVDWVTMKAVVALSNGFTLGCWSVNTLETDPEAIMLFDEHLTLPVDIPSSSTMFYIENGRITRAVPGEQLTVPAGVKVLVYNSGIVGIEKGYHRLPEVGMTAEVKIAASGTSRDAEWSNVKDALTGGPLLVKNGVNVVDGEGNQGYYGDPKQKPDTVLSRAFVGITPTGGLVLGTATASFRQIADWMVANNIREGLAMDGGASAMLYANGAFSQAAGRSLASVLAIVDEGGSQPPAPTAEEPSSWAAAEVQAAIGAGLLPESLRSGYKTDITRQDFCLLTWELMKKQPGISQQLQSSEPVSFSDTSNEAVLGCARLGIISGVGGGRFDPDSTLTRAQAAKILANTANLLGVIDTEEQYAFTDRASFPSWDKGWIDFCGAKGIMKGDNGAFNPNGHITRQEAILTVYRIYDRYGAK